jgi:predicted hydrocarbon binding protein
MVTENTPENNSELLKFCGDILSSVLKGLSTLDVDTQKKVMELCGETCAKAVLFAGGQLDIASRISQEENDEDELLRRVNQEILWCGKWTRIGNVIKATCEECGCPLVKNNIIQISPTFCYCSRGWMKKIFETVFKRPVEVELTKAIGRGDNMCQFKVKL